MASNLVNRTLSALVLIPVALGAVYLGGIVLYILLALIAGLALAEWRRMTRGKRHRIMLNAAGLLYIGLPMLSFAWISGIFLGPVFAFFLLAIVWATDIGAYIFGRLIGGPKLAPRISPNKTWAGFCGGLIFAALVSLSPLLFVDTAEGSVDILAAGLLLSLAAHAGDFLESWIKRRFGVKDSGTIIPGHGGVLDRIDSLLIAAPIAALLVFIFRHST